MRPPVDDYGEAARLDLLILVVDDNADVGGSLAETLRL